MLASAREHYLRQQRIAREGLRRARLARFGPLAGLVSAVVAYQGRAAEDAVAAVPLMLAEQGINPDPVARVIPAALVGVASDGRSLSSLLDLTRQSGFTPKQFDRLVLTQFTDMARQGASLGMAVRPSVTRYTRMLVPPSCSRCAVLAGRTYRSEQAFQRHPRCDCRHIPTDEATAGDLTTDPKAYFDSLPTAADLAEQYPDIGVKMRQEMGIYSQEDIFTKAGARAIRDGADISRVVNARAGMSTAQPPLRGRGDRWTARGPRARVDVFGRQLYTTTEATTKRGVNRKVRLMPESIYEVAENRADALRLLKAHGYIR